MRSTTFIVASEVRRLQSDSDKCAMLVAAGESATSQAFLVILDLADFELRRLVA